MAVNIINELKRWFDKQSIPQPSVEPSDKEKIERAVAIMAEKGVSEKLEFLLNDYQHDFGAFKFSSERVYGRKFQESGNESLIDRKIRCATVDRILEVVVTNLRNTFGDEDTADLAVLYNQETVYSGIVWKGRDMGGGDLYRVHISGILEFSFKNGPWMDYLDLIVAETRKHDESEQHQRDVEQTKLRASKIDLG